MEELDKSATINRLNLAFEDIRSSDYSTEVAAAYDRPGLVLHGLTGNVGRLTTLIVAVVTSDTALANFPVIVC